MAKSKVESWLDEMEREANAPDPVTTAAENPLVRSSEEALSVLWTPEPAEAGHRKTVEDILVAKGKLEGEKLLQARSIQSTSRGKKITQILQEMAAVGEEDIQRAVAENMSLPYESIDPKRVDRRAFDYLS